MTLSTCAMIFRPDNWDVPQQLTATPAPLFVGSYDTPRQLKSISEFLAKAVTFDSLSAKLSFVDTLKVIQKNLGASSCFIKKSEVETFDAMFFSFKKPGWYQMTSTRDIEVQVFTDKCTEELSCPTKILVRYGSSVMGMDVSGPVKNISEYSVTKVTQSTRGLRYIPGAKAGEHKINFSYGSDLYLTVLNNDGIVSLGMDLTIVAGYPSSRGLCNIPRLPSPDNKLVGSDGRFYSREKKDEVDAFTNSWKVKDEDVLTNPGAKTLILPPQSGICAKSQKTHGQNPTFTTGGYVPPPPPAPGGYVPPPPPPSSQPDVIAAALLQVSPRKAPDDDGISTAFYQAALYMPANTPQGVPPTPFACALLRVCGQVFASATIPRAWLCASIVSIDKKDGDPLNPGDWAISETCITSSKFRFTVPGFDVIQHPATGPGRRGISLGIPSWFGGHERNLLHQQ
ncbi:hypothetical protein BASA61_009392 [Batrachochytrium salamandrivorans]|nr:hypothetical protein BASA61_009392 [Batrachochytrium salamandrivorans]